MTQPQLLPHPILDALFTIYKRLFSPVLHALAPGRGGCCYQPTCSEYAALAVAQHGLARGGLMATTRLLRCNPFSHGGWDPVPPAQKQRGAA